MKLKSLLAIISCSAIAFSISVPSIAETLKDIQVQSQSNGIENKEYGNKQNASLIVGSWFSSVSDNEYKQNNPLEIYWDIKSDGTTTFAFRPKSGDNFSNTAYQYSSTSKNGGIWKEDFGSGEGALCTIEWISNDEFILTIVKEYTRPEREGIQRRFVRIQEPVATILQERAQQAAAREESRRNLQRARDNYNDVNNSWGSFGGAIDAIKGRY